MICEHCDRKATRKLRRITNAFTYKWRYRCGYCANRIKRGNENSHSSIIEEVIL